MARRFFYFVSIIFALVILACSIPGAIRQNQPPVSTVVETAAIPTMTPVVVVPTNTIETIPTATEPVNMGTVTGQLSYPSEFIPAQRVFLYQANDLAQYYSVDTAVNQNTYSIDVPAGTYFVVAYVIDGGLAAGYTQAVPCGLTVDCNDHALIPIVVSAGETLENINPADWYGPQEDLPPMS